MKVVTSALPAVAGIVSHVVYFNRGEHHLSSILYAQLLLLGSIILAATLALAKGDGVRASSIQTIFVILWYFVGLYSSLLTYRLWLHPLKGFPGPFGAKISNLWFSFQLQDSRAFRKVLELHETYGEFVRIGSSDLSIIHPNGVGVIYGSTSKCAKGPFYDLTRPMVSLQTTRDKMLHNRRRRLWSNAFGDKQLREYEQRIYIYRQRLMSRISTAATDAAVLDISKWFNLFTFDVMGDLAFGAPFHMLETSEQHWAIKTLQEGIKPLAFHLPVWLFRLLTGIPGLSRGWWSFIGYCCQMLDNRIMNKPDWPDVMSTLLAPWEGKSIPPYERKLLEGDSELIIVAGSDTTAATLTNILYQLLRNPGHITHLRQELAPYFANSLVDCDRIQNLDHLNGIINEALRLHPPVPTALPRLTPPGGINVGDRHIPGGITVWCSQYAIGRTESLYPDANSFIPERWYSRPDMVVDKTVFAPFSTGSYGCIGKPLALQNIRNTISELVMRFDISPGPNGDMEVFEEKTIEHFTLGLPPLRLCFSPRA